MDAASCKSNKINKCATRGATCRMQHSHSSYFQEAVRGGHVETVAILLEHGADVNARTKTRGKGAAGGSALWWAIESHGQEHAIVELLKANGAKLFAPGQGGEL